MELNCYNMFSGVMCGLLSIGLAFLIPLTGGGVFKTTLTVTGVTWGPVVGIFILAAFVPSVDTLVSTF